MVCFPVQSHIGMVSVMTTVSQTTIRNCLGSDTVLGLAEMELHSNLYSAVLCSGSQKGVGNTSVLTTAEQCSYSIKAAPPTFPHHLGRHKGEKKCK